MINTADQILQIIQDHGPLYTREIASLLREKYKLSLDKTEINSLLYGPLHKFVIRDKDKLGFPVWRIKRAAFEASSGLEVMLHNKLLKENIVSTTYSQLDYKVENRRNGKTYHLDIAVFENGEKLNIEIDGFEHVRADARLSIQKQIEQNKKIKEIEIDWMDNSSSYTDFTNIDNSRVFKWLLENRAWCIKYHEELLWGRDITRNIYLIDSGWSIIRFWNFQIKDNINECISTIKTYLPK